MSARPIVLVHGAWGGAWIWRRVLAPLRAAGHEVHASRSPATASVRTCAPRHQAGRRTCRRVWPRCEAEELHDVLLVGHSYGGMVVTGAADRLLQARPACVAGWCMSMRWCRCPAKAGASSTAPEMVAARTRPPWPTTTRCHRPTRPTSRIHGADRDWLLRRHVPHPFGMYRDRCISTARSSMRCRAPSSTAPSRPTRPSPRCASACASCPASRWRSWPPGTARW
jgi:pimeloyl-ACP methyl ester carboxylesterase